MKIFGIGELTAPFDGAQSDRGRNERKKESGIVEAGFKPALIAFTGLRRLLVSRHAH
jgi:hypothetical protein